MRKWEGVFVILSSVAIGIAVGAALPALILIGVVVWRGRYWHKSRVRPTARLQGSIRTTLSDLKNIEEAVKNSSADEWEFPDSPIKY